MVVEISILEEEKEEVVIIIEPGMSIDCISNNSNRDSNIGIQKGRFGITKLNSW